MVFDEVTIALPVKLSLSQDKHITDKPDINHKTTIGVGSWTGKDQLLNVFLDEERFLYTAPS